MSGRGKLLTTLSVLSILVSPVVAAPPEGITPPRVRPIGESIVRIEPWEHASSSPFGGFRMGGSDRRNFALSTDGKHLLTEDAGGWQLELWDVATGKSLGRFGRINDPVALAFSPDGKRAVSTDVGSREGGAVEIWDVARRKRVAKLDEDVNFTPFSAVDFSPDGKTVAMGASWGRRAPSDFSIHIWDIATGDELRRIDPPSSAETNKEHYRSHLYDCLAFSPDGRSLAVVVDRQVLLLEVATGQERCRLGVLPSLFKRDEPDKAAPSCAFSPDGRALAVACADGAVRLWDLTTGQELLPLANHKAGVLAVRFSRDGKKLFSFGLDNRMLTWPVAEALRDWHPRRTKLTEQDLESLWAGLRDRDRLTHFGNVQALADHPAESLPFLRKRVKVVPRVDPERINRLVRDLEHADFNVRRAAAREMRKLGDLALPALETVGKHDYDGIAHRLLQGMSGMYPTVEQLQALRALEVLERAGTDEARRLLSELAQGASESLLTRQAQAALERLKKPAGEPTIKVDLPGLWAVLAKDDARQAYRAVRALAAQPREAVPFLRDRLRPLAASGLDDPERIARLIKDLNAESFAVREKATGELRRLGKRAETALKKAVEDNPSLELRRRVKGLLEDISDPRPLPEQLQAIRAIEALERAGTPQARQVLEALGKEAKNHWLKAEVTGVLDRLRP